MTDINQAGIWRFNEKHSVSEDQQFRALVEEVGELAEQLNREADDEAVAEELADVIFVARSIAELHNIDISREVNTVIDENLEKDSETDGQKVTKSGDFASRSNSSEKFDDSDTESTTQYADSENPKKSSEVTKSSDDSAPRNDSSETDHQLRTRTIDTSDSEETVVISDE